MNRRGILKAMFSAIGLSGLGVSRALAIAPLTAADATITVAHDDGSVEDIDFAVGDMIFDQRTGDSMKITKISSSGVTK